MLTEGEAVQLLKRYLEERCSEDVEEFALQYPDSTSFLIEYWTMVNYSRDLEDLFEEDPLKLLKCASLAIKQIELACDVEFKDITVRVKGFPRKTPIREIRHKHIQKFIQIEGLVRKSSDVKPKYAEIAFECLRCGHINYIPQPQRKMIEPLECENSTCGKKGPFKISHPLSKYEDFQILEIQESPDTLTGTQQPRNIPVYVYNELADKATAGDKVVIGGVVVTSLQINREGKSTISDLILEANTIEKTDKQYEEIDITPEEIDEILALSRDPDVKRKFIDSIAPSICGYDNIKEALCLQLVSGVAKNLEDGTRIRGDIHSLLVGDPGTAKSQLIKRVVGLSPRGVFNSGKSASGVGLTAAVVKDPMNEDRWTLEGGALVMADNGLCVVDEMDKMRPEDISSLHEGMEQQTITVTKAGIHASLNTRCAIVGAANPKHGRFDPNEGIAEQINMPPALLSRFDLIYVVRDEPDIERDTKIAKHISKNHSCRAGEDNHLRPCIKPEFFRKYIAYARSNVKPSISEEAEEAITNFYVKARNGQKDKAIPITARSLDGLYRLAEASARVRLSHIVTKKDADDAIRLVADCLRNVGIDPETGKFDIDIIEVGGTTSQREKIKIIKNLIKESKRIDFDALTRVSGFSKEICSKCIKELKNKGDIFEIQEGLYTVS